MAKLTAALEPCMEDALACARDAEDRDRQVSLVGWLVGCVEGGFRVGGVSLILLLLFLQKVS